MESMADDLFMGEEHRLLRAQIRRYVQAELAPHVDRFERELTFPRQIYRDMGAQGFLGIGFPEQLGGSGGDLLHMVVVCEELIRSGSPGLGASLGSHGIAVPPIVNAGTAAQQARWLPRIFSGEWIAALAVTEPDAGSDVASIRTRAVRDGDHFVVNGRKTFITSGSRADFITAVVRTGEEGWGGISLLGIETNSPGFHVARVLDKMGWHASDTAELVFEDLRVPVDNLIGPLDGGFPVLMQNFGTERLILAASAVEMAQMAFEAALRYANEREAFGRAIARFQVNRHRLAEMKSGIEVCRTFVYGLAAQISRGVPCFAEVAMAKNAATDMASRVIDQAVQIHGGYGYMREYLVERLYRDIRLYPIGGGTREVMNELIAKSLGI